VASGKKRRKQANVVRKRQRPPSSVFRHPDGDRRRKGEPTYEEGAAQKHTMQQLGATPPTSNDEEE
jgi:hypothetical protein